MVIERNSASIIFAKRYPTTAMILPACLYLWRNLLQYDGAMLLVQCCWSCKVIAYLEISSWLWYFVAWKKTLYSSRRTPKPSFGNNLSKKNSSLSFFKEKKNVSPLNIFVFIACIIMYLCTHPSHLAQYYIYYFLTIENDFFMKLWFSTFCSKRVK